MRCADASDIGPPNCLHISFRSYIAGVYGRSHAERTVGQRSRGPLIIACRNTTWLVSFNRTPRRYQ